MNDDDRKEFADKMTEMATVLGRPIDGEDISAYFNQLKDYPVDIVIKGIDQALQDRDPEDEFLKLTMITLPEIRGAIERISAKELGKVGEVANCKECHGQGWITSEDESGGFTARPCKCLYTVARHTMASKKKPTAKEIDSRRHAEEIVKAYELFIIKEEKRNED